MGTTIALLTQCLLDICIYICFVIDTLCKDVAPPL